MNGFIEIPVRKRKFPFTFEDSTLTVYSANSISIDTMADVKIESDVNYLVGVNIENNTTVIFFVDEIPFSNDGPILWTSATARVYYYVDNLHQQRDFFPDKAVFRFEELNYFFDLNAGITRSIDPDEKTQKVETLPYDATKETFTFSNHGNEVRAELGIVQTLNGYSATPLELYSQLKLDFDATSNIEFVIDLYSVVKRFFCFLCYRRSINIGIIELYGTDGQKRCSMGTLHLLFNQNDYMEAHDTIRKTVKYCYLKSHITNIVQAVADEQLYYEHIPQNREDGNHITVDRTILATAAFEWTYKQLYDEIPLSKYRQEVKSDVVDVLERLSGEKGYNSKKKKELKHYKRAIELMDRNLSERIIIALTDSNSILEPFILRLYAINNIEPAPYTQIADDLQYQRNAYAHGAIDRELKENIVLDVLILEWLVYCMAFKLFQYSEVEIFNAINQIFRRGFADKTEGGELT